ncbi:hypothetical protein IV203_002821 [Nitzschia inconspicua]|uniref:Uncharacterized protein n=1 Tax=Nitzschia inconspicua TaxID=303405 RepID=A0A9K3L253_9STRA|nr:hypothetical protein IV203_002821 [Nitzschia inconspicua]
MNQAHMSSVSRKWIQFVAILLLSLTGKHSTIKAFSFLSLSKGRHVTEASTSLILLSSTMDGEDASSAVAATTTRKKPLSPKEILERQREMKGLTADEDEYPKLFDDGLLDNMQQMLLLLEKRVRDGPGSLSMIEVKEFITMSQSITLDMKEKERQRLQDAAAPPPPTVADSAAMESAASVSAAPSALAAVTEVPTQPNAVQPPTPTVSSLEAQQSPATAKSESEDGPAYDPSGGQGSLAKGTRNTYIIPNMEEMSPEEYQKALQKSLFDQQAERRRKLQAGYGNRASWDYLNNLTGESGQLKSDSAFDD